MTFDRADLITVSYLFGMCQKRAVFVSGRNITGYPALVDMCRMCVIGV